MGPQRSSRRRCAAFAPVAALAACFLATGAARAAQPITIGFGMALTGGLAAAGKSALLAMQIWRDDVNAKGGLLGRPVKLVYYDDQSNPATVPGIYTKLLDVDKVDLIVSGYGTNLIAPAMPIAISHDRLFLGLFGLAVNSEFHYPKYFSMLPTGPDPKHAFCEPFFKVALRGKPEAQDAGAARRGRRISEERLRGRARHRQEERARNRLRQDLSAGDADFTPIVHAIQATNPDMVFVASYPPDSVGMLRAATEVGLKTRFFGGGMVGLQYTSVKEQFGPKLNGIVDYDWWIPAPTMQFPGITDFLKKYQAKAAGRRRRPAGLVFAALRLCRSAGAGRRDGRRPRASTRPSSPTTSAATRSRPSSATSAFGKDGEWSKPRVLEVQWQGIKNNSLDQFKDTKTEVILEPAQYRTGTVTAPYNGSAGE